VTEIEVLRLAGGELITHDLLQEFTERWLVNRRFSPHTQEAYRRDVGQWLTWCAQHELDPLRAGWTDVNAWGRFLEAPDTGRGLAVATVARKMSAVSSWYAFLVKLGALGANPAAAADRPSVDRDYSTTVSFSHEDASAMLRVAARGDAWIGPVELGTRATETTMVQIGNLGYDRGFRIVHMQEMKGGRQRVRVIPPPLAALLEQYLAGRAAAEGVEIEQLQGQLFVDALGQPLTRHDIYRFVRRLARIAGLANAEKITPHSFRHAWNRMARRRGAALEDRQFAMGHRDPRTTRRYDAADVALERDPSLLVAAAVAEPFDGEGR
jgi:integrase/recombinase XerD